MSQAYESLYDALHACVRALGGAKGVGLRMRPEKGMDAAQGWLLDCLNPHRAEKLDPEQVLWLLRESRRVGCHEAMEFIAGEAGYATPAPITRETEQATLQREFIAAVAKQERLIASMRAAGVNVEGMA